MKRKILTYGGYFEAFMSTLKEKEQEKIQYGLLLLKTQERLSKKFVKHIRDGIYELRTEYAGNIYRIFFIFDNGQIVVLFNGFQKKTQKTPANEIEKAIKITTSYLMRSLVKREHKSVLRQKKLLIRSILVRFFKMQEKRLKLLKRS